MTDAQREIRPDEWSSPVVFLEARRREMPGALYSGSGMLVTRAGGVALVTAWHNLTSRHVDTKVSLHDQCVEPEFVRIYPLSRLAPGEWSGIDVPLHDDHGTPTWLEHPEVERCVDVGVVAVPEYQAVAPLIDSLLQEPMDDECVGDEVFVLGFPYGMLPTAGLPIWKRGSLASEPTARVFAEEKLLVDASARSGMSGGAVIRRIRKRDPYDTRRPITQLLGLYSGRMRPPRAKADESSDLGIVWRWSVVEDVIANGRLGRGSDELAALVYEK